MMTQHIIDIPTVVTTSTTFYIRKSDMWSNTPNRGWTQDNYRNAKLREKQEWLAKLSKRRF